MPFLDTLKEKLNDNGFQRIWVDPIRRGAISFGHDTNDPIRGRVYINNGYIDIAAYSMRKFRTEEVRNAFTRIGERLVAQQPGQYYTRPAIGGDGISTIGIQHERQLSNNTQDQDDDANWAWDRINESIVPILNQINPNH